jgi:hypothetical protein
MATKKKPQSTVVVDTSKEVDDDKLSNQQLADLYGALTTRVQRMLADPVFKRQQEIEDALRLRVYETKKHTEKVELKGKEWIVTLPSVKKELDMRDIRHRKIKKRNT